jgi:hypothetical protein
MRLIAFQSQFDTFVLFSKPAQHIGIQGAIRAICNVPAVANIGLISHCMHSSFTCNARTEELSKWSQIAFFPFTNVGTRG